MVSQIKAPWSLNSTLRWIFVTQQNLTFCTLQVLATEAQDGVTCSTMQQERVSHASVGLSQPACLRTSDISWKGQSDQRCLKPKISNRKKVSIFLNESSNCIFERIYCLHFQMRILYLLLLVVCLSRAQELSKSIGLYASTGDYYLCHLGCWESGIMGVCRDSSPTVGCR